jgi:hypothetical protein
VFALKAFSNANVCSLERTKELTAKVVDIDTTALKLSISMAKIKVAT